MGEICILQILSYINDYIVPMAIFITWAKIYSSKCFCKTRVHVGGLGEIFRLWNILNVYVHVYTVFQLNVILVCAT